MICILIDFTLISVDKLLLFWIYISSGRRMEEWWRYRQAGYSHSCKHHNQNKKSRIGKQAVLTDPALWRWKDVWLFFWLFATTAEHSAQCIFDFLKGIFGGVGDAIQHIASFVLCISGGIFGFVH